MKLDVKFPSKTMTTAGVGILLVAAVVLALFGKRGIVFAATLVVTSFLVSLAVASPTLIGILHRRGKYIYPRKGDSAMPFIDANQDAAIAALEGRLRAMESQASQPTYGTYAPRMMVAGQQPTYNELPTREVPQLPSRSVPTLGDLIRSGEVGPGMPVYLGHTPDGPLTETWELVGSIAYGGKPRSSKSGIAAFFFCQAILANDGGDGQFYLTDPHAGRDTSLANRLGRLESFLSGPIVQDHAGLLKQLRRARAVMESRKSNNDTSPFVVVVDELTEIILDPNCPPEIPELMTTLAHGGPKFGVFIHIIGHRWATDAVDPTLRNNITTKVVCELVRDEARNLTNLPAERLPNDTDTLMPGECYIVRKGVCTKVRVPKVTKSCVLEVIRFASGSLSSEPVPRGFLAGSNPALEVGSVGSHGSPGTGSVTGFPFDGNQISMILEMTSKSISRTHIARTVKRDPTLAGRALQGAIAEIDAVVAQAMRGGRFQPPSGNVIDAVGFFADEEDETGE